MVSKDQAIGGLIFIVCFAVGILYVLTLFDPWWLGVFGVTNIAWNSGIQFWLIAVPVFIAFVAVMAIGAWIGWTMATTPPPKPIEEITSEIEKKEETTPQPPEEPKPPEEAVEEKKAERKKKS
jgi:predicted DNA-binding transcriptional regulator